MFEILKATAMGVVEGLTEFIPVSSTGHLILVGKWISFDNPTFEIAIQLGAILAVVVLYRSFFIKFFHPKTWFKRDMNNIVLAMLPVLVVGLLAHNIIKSLFSPTVVITALFVGGVAMIVVEKWVKPKTKTHELSKITPQQAFIVGLCQCFSLLPGMSRSGSTIVGGLLAGLDYAVAAEFSFIVAVPVMAAAVGFDLLKSADTLTSQDLGLITIGFVVSFFVAMASIVTFLKLLQKLKLTPFGVYRIIVSVILVLGLLV